MNQEKWPLFRFRYDVMYVYLYNYAEIDLKYNSSDATLLLSTIGISNTIGEVIVGWLGDQSWTNLNALYAICMLMCGAATAVVPFMSHFTALAISAGLFGFFISANYSLTSPILVKYVSLEQVRTFFLCQCHLIRKRCRRKGSHPITLLE